MGPAVIWSLGCFQTFFLAAFALFLYHPNFYYRSFANFGYCTVETSISEEILVEFSFTIITFHYFKSKI